MTYTTRDPYKKESISLIFKRITLSETIIFRDYTNFMGARISCEYIFLERISIGV